MRAWWRVGAASGRGVEGGLEARRWTRAERRGTVGGGEEGEERRRRRVERVRKGDI